MKEDQHTEFKRLWKDEYIQYVSGFANAQGGTLYIGVDDDGSVCGVANAAKLLADLPNQINQATGVLAEVNLLNEDGKEYIAIHINVTIPRDPSIYGDYSDSRGNVTGHETDHETDQVTDQVTDHVRRLVKVVHGVAKTREEIMALLKLKHRGNLRDLYLNPAIDAGYVVMLYPDNPKRKGQAYYLTEKGKSLYQQLFEE